MSTPNNPHDKLFKAAFSEKDVVIDFIDNFLPERVGDKIYKDSLTLMPVSYIHPSLADFYSDIVYSCEFGESSIQITLLFEHKSYVPEYPHLQLLRYMVEAWFQMLKQEEELKPIIPIVVYHGKDKWAIRSFEEYFGTIDPALRPFLPSFEYLLTDLNKWSDERLEKLSMGILRQALVLLKDTRNQMDIRPFFLELFSSLEPYTQANQYSNLLISFSVYIWSVSGIPEETFIKLVGELPSSVNKQVMTTYEQIIRKGEERAKKAQQDHVISQGLKSGLSIDLIGKLAALSVEEVKARILELGLDKS